MVALTIVFDLDGTLVDTAPDLIATLNVVFAASGSSRSTYEEARNMIGGGARRHDRAGAHLHGRTCTSGGDRPDVRATSSPTTRPHRRPVAAVPRPRRSPRCSGGAAAAGFAVCTNKLEGLSRRLLDALGLTARFAAICGQDTFGVQKPDPEILRATIGGRRATRQTAPSWSGIRAPTSPRRARPACRSSRSTSAIASPGRAVSRPDRLISHFDELPGAIAELFESNLNGRR